MEAQSLNHWIAREVPCSLLSSVWCSLGFNIGQAWSFCRTAREQDGRCWEAPEAEVSVFLWLRLSTLWTWEAETLGGAWSGSLPLSPLQSAPAGESFSLLFSWLFWDISYPAERPEIFRRMPLALGGAESHTLCSPHLDHPLQDTQGRVGIHTLSCKEQKIPPKLSQGCSSKSRGSPRLRVLQIHCGPGAQEVSPRPSFSFCPLSSFFSVI